MCKVTNIGRIEGVAATNPMGFRNIGLDSIGIKNKDLSGDTRFDRVWDAAQEKREFPLVERFLGGRTCLMAGSTWPFDDQLLKEIIPAFPDLKFVIVPHHVDEANIRRIRDLFGDQMALYTKGEDQDLEDRQVLVVDTIGILTYLYRLADLTYIGDGFGAGIHSILEPAAFGMPIFFGPNYHNFQEAVDLLERRGVLAVNDQKELREGIRRFADDKNARQAVGQICREYIEEKRGATDRIMMGLRKFLGDRNKVKVSLQFRGREMAHIDIGKNLMDRIAAEMGEEAVIEKYPRLEGRFMTMIIAPKT